MVHCEKFAENLTLNLLDEFRKSIPIYKATLFGVVAMKIKIKRKPTIAN